MRCKEFVGEKFYDWVCDVLEIVDLVKKRVVEVRVLGLVSKIMLWMYVFLMLVVLF